MPLTAGRNRYAWGGIIVLAATVVTLLLDQFGALQRMEWITYDARMELTRDNSRLHPELAVVLIDDASLHAMDPLVGRWPWPRSVYADVLEFMAMGGARAVVFDILLAETHEPSSDRRLARTGEETGIAFHAAQIMREGTRDAAGLGRPLPKDFADAFAIGKAKQFVDRGANSYILPLAPLYRSAADIGVVGVDADSDSVYRRLNLFSVYRDRVFPALSVTPLLHETEPPTLRYEPDELQWDRQTIPLDGDGHYLVNMVDDYAPYSISGILSSIQKLRAG